MLAGPKKLVRGAAINRMENQPKEISANGKSTQNLYYITIREPGISMPSMPTPTNGVPLGPG